MLIHSGTATPAARFDRLRRGQEAMVDAAGSTPPTSRSWKRVLATAALLILLGGLAQGPAAPAQATSAESVPEMLLADHVGGRGSHSLAVHPSMVALGYPFRVLLVDDRLPMDRAILAEIPLPAMPNAMAFDGDRLFVAVAASGLAIVDVRVPREPRIDHWLRLPDPHDVKIRGGKAYVAGATGLAIVDVEGSGPRLLSSLATEKGLRHLDVDEIRVVATGGARAHRIDVTDPLRPVLDATYDSVHEKFEVILDGARAFVATSWTIDVLALGAQTGLSLLASIPADDRSMNSLALAGDLLFATDWFDGLLVYDVSDPVAVKQIGELSGFPTLQYLSRSGDDLVAIQYRRDGMVRIDVSDPRSPILRGAFRLEEGDSWGWSASSLQLLGEAVLVQSYRTDTLFDVQSLPRVQTVSVPEGSVGRSRDLVPLDGQLVSVGVRDLRVLEPESPTRFVQVGRYDLGPSEAIEDFAIDRRHAYLLTRKRELVIVDLDAPEHVVERTRITLASVYGSVHTLAIHEDGVLLVALEQANREGPVRAGLLVLDVTRPESPEEIGFVPIEGRVRNILVQQSAAVLSQGNGLLLLDLADPRQPHLASRHGLTAPVRSLASDGSGRGLLVASGNTVTRFDRIGPDTLVPSATFRCRGGDACRSARWVGDRLLVAHGDTGLVVARMPDPTGRQRVLLPLVRR